MTTNELNKGNLAREEENVNGRDALRGLHVKVNKTNEKM